MGRTFDDPEVQKEVERRPYKILEGLSGRVNIQVTQRDQVKTFLPQEISALVCYSIAHEKRTNHRGQKQLGMC